MNFSNLLEKICAKELDKEKNFYLKEENKNLFKIFIIVITSLTYLPIFDFYIPSSFDQLMGLGTIFVYFVLLTSTIIYLFLFIPSYMCVKEEINSEKREHNKERIEKNKNNYFLSILFIIWFTLLTFTFWLSILNNKDLISLTFILTIITLIVYLVLLIFIAKNHIIRIIIAILLLFLSATYFNIPLKIVKKYHIAKYLSTLIINYSNPICHKKKIIFINNKKYCEINATIIWNNGQQTIFKIKNKNKTEIHQLNNSYIIDTIIF